MKVALVHDFLKEYGGAERFLEVLSELFPDAPIFTAFYLPQNMHRRFETRDVRVHAIQRLPLLSLLSKQYTFLYPIVFESFNLDEFDVVISSSASFAKGVITKPSTLHISYIHTPPRFLYHYPSEVSRREKWYYKPFLYPLDHLLRMWDFLAAQRPDILVANSAFTQARIKKFYRRDATIMYPPLSLPDVSKPKRLYPRPYFLVVGRVRSYKNVELAVEACVVEKKDVVVVGTGAMDTLKKRYQNHPKVKIAGFVDDETLVSYYAHCEALIFPVEEDFGLVPIECMSQGKPVLALKKGGALETVKEKETGLFFQEATVAEISSAIRRFSYTTFSEGTIRAHAQEYSRKKFEEEFLSFVETSWETHQRTLERAHARVA